MPTSVNEQAADAVNFNNVKVIGEVPASTMGLALQDAVNSQRRMQAVADSVAANIMNTAQQAERNASILAQAMMARASRFMLDISGEQAAAFEKILGAQLQDQITELGASVASVQQNLKGAQTTPPQTGTGGAFGSDAGSAVLQQLVNNQAAMVAQMASLAAAIEGLAKKP